MDTANQFFVRELQDMYNAEKQAVRTLSEIEQQCRRSEIKKAAARHRRQTEGQIKRLDNVFKAMGVPPSERNCEGISGIVQEKKAIENEQLSQDLVDLNALMSALKFERYEVSAYESLIFLAQQMKMNEAVRLLKETLKEEQDAAKLMLEQLKKTRMDWQADIAGQGTITARGAMAGRRTPRAGGAATGVRGEMGPATGQSATAMLPRTRTRRRKAA